MDTASKKLFIGAEQTYSVVTLLLLHLRMLLTNITHPSSTAHSCINWHIWNMRDGTMQVCCNRVNLDVAGMLVRILYWYYTAYLRCETNTHRNIYTYCLRVSTSIGTWILITFKEYEITWFDCICWFHGFLLWYTCVVTTFNLDHMVGVY
jgi:hypothetical protein